MTVPKLKRKREKVTNLSNAYLHICILHMWVFKNSEFINSMGKASPKFLHFFQHFYAQMKYIIFRFFCSYLLMVLMRVKYIYLFNFDHGSIFQFNLNDQPETQILLGSNAYLFPIQLIHASITMIRALYKPRIYFHQIKRKVGSESLY